MSRKNYRIMWSNLKAVVLFGKSRYSKEQLLKIMFSLELTDEQRKLEDKIKSDI